MTADARFKPVPEPPGALAELETARRAVPLVPEPEGDCCARVGDRLGLRDRDAARTWLTFLRALELVDESSRGHHRTRTEFDSDAIATAFRERVFGVEEVLDAFETADRPLDADAAFEQIRESVPEWERRRHDDWETVWQTRTERVLAWAALFGLVEETDHGYRRSST